MLVSIGVGGLTYLLLINLSSFLTHNHKRSFNRSAKEINISQDEITLMRCYNQSFFWSSIFFIITSFSEEFIWRGYLITVLTSDFKIHQLIALLTSALSFGSIHYYYRKLALPQILHGLILGALFLLTHTILAPFIAHLTYNFLSLRSMYETLKNLPKPEETTLPKKIFLSRDE
jgi:membrane protease YdiL (CAAX protease family)